jgi:nitrate reductase alpha subunit
MQRIGDSYGYDSIHVFGQVPGSGYIQKGANYRASALLGMSHGTSFDYNGDLPMGMPITFGVQNAEHEAKDWANALPARRGREPARDSSAHLFDAAAARAIVVVDGVQRHGVEIEPWIRLTGDRRSVRARRGGQ